MRTPPDSEDTIGTIELELLKLVRHLETFGRRSSPHLRVDRAGYLALRTLEDLGPLSTKSLASALSLDASTVTRQIGVLEAAGLVQRQPDPHDRRSSTIALTADGRRMMGGVEHERRQGVEALVSDWVKAERTALARALSQLNAALQKSVGSTRVD